MLSTLIIEDNAIYRQSLHHLLTERFPIMLIAEAADGSMPCTRRWSSALI